MLRVADKHALSDTGRQRRANEDACFARAPLFVVADGMGGAQAGEVASRLAVESFEPGLDDGDKSAEAALSARIRLANERIHDLAQSDRARQGMGTTITAAVVGEHDVAVAHVGDSRAYRLRDGALERLTDDHSLVEELQRQGKLTAQEATHHPQRSIITRALGPEPSVEVDSATWPAEPGDVFLLCSDGLTSMIEDHQVAAVVREAPSMEQAARSLVAAANEAGGRDNITVVLFRLEEVTGAAAGAAADPPTAEHALPPEAAPEDQPTRAGRPGDGLTTSRVRTAMAEQEEERARREAAEARRIAPRPGGEGSDQEGGPRRSRLRRVLIALGVTAAIVLPVGIAAWLAIGSVYFIGSGPQGFVAVYRGLPYELPLGVDLYTSAYVSGVPLGGVEEQRREQLLDHTLRSREDAADLVRRLEIGELAGS
ncbi:MAG: Stp1/IreP family PP2C-type Ser/Thr phosphatase [Solirubrobacteraceae bacterium MAG38_C4-C5]|nr:Stp1/IreP family PP2C-type Ser/Thr phosphatase [Candidatus Siliceabacter maunaloa]